MKFEIYKSIVQDTRGTTNTFFRPEYRWRLKARNGRIIACSGEGYKNWKHCLKMIDKINAGVKCRVDFNYKS